MSIKFNVVTWYSKLLSVIFFIAVLPVWTFYVGMKVKEVEVYANPAGLDGVSFANFISSKKHETKLPKIDVGQNVLEGKVFGMVQNIYEKDGKLWVNIDPADQVSALECVFRAYDANISKSCDESNGIGTWNISTSTITMPLSDQASLAVYYNDGTKIGLKPKLVTTKNGKLYTFSLSPILSSVGSSSTSTLDTLVKSYDRILSYDGDDTYRWNPLMYIEIKKGDAKLSEDPSKSYVRTIEEVWRP